MSDRKKMVAGKVSLAVVASCFILALVMMTAQKNTSDDIADLKPHLGTATILLADLKPHLVLALA